jgi:hypothetical protein
MANAIAIENTARQRFADFVWVIPERLIMPLAIYIDESGTHDGSDLIAMGGYVGWKDDWQTFSGEWESVLCDYRVQDFHAVEFMRSPAIQEADKNSPYRGWSPDKREQFILDLAAATRPHVSPTAKYLIASVSVSGNSGFAFMWALSQMLTG